MVSPTEVCLPQSRKLATEVKEGTVTESSCQVTRTSWLSLSHAQFVVKYFNWFISALVGVALHSAENLHSAQRLLTIHLQIG